MIDHCFSFKVVKVQNFEENLFKKIILKFHERKHKLVLITELLSLGNALLTNCVTQEAK